MALKETINEHRKMWNTIADRLENWNKTDNLYSKADYIYENHLNLSYDCFVCEYARKELVYSCSKCPAIWSGGMSNTGILCLYAGSEYAQYCVLSGKIQTGEVSKSKENVTELSRLARAVANIKFRGAQGVEYV